MFLVEPVAGGETGDYRMRRVEEKDIHTPENTSPLLG
jgi:hypothetical protein